MGGYTLYTQGNNFKKELFFSVICIAIYFLSLILANIISNIVIKIPNSINALVEILFPVSILILLRKKKLLSYYGLNSLKKLNYKNLLFCIPMIIIPIVNLCFGIHINYLWQEILLICITMLGVGFSEEMLFRSFLIRTIANKNSKAAIVLPSILFGVVHITNFFGGKDIAMTILQMVYATSFGFMCSVFFYKTNNIIPCIICHSATNITNIFLPNNLPVEYGYVECIVIIVPSAFYAWYLYITKKYLTKDT